MSASAIRTVRAWVLCGYTIFCMLQCTGCAARAPDLPTATLTPLPTSAPALNLDADLVPLMREASDLPSGYEPGTIQTTPPPGSLADQSVPPIRYAATSARNRLQQSQIAFQIFRYRTHAQATEQLARLGQAGGAAVPGLGDQALLRSQRVPGQVARTLSFTRCGALASVTATAHVDEELLSLDQLSGYAQELDIQLERALCRTP